MVTRAAYEQLFDEAERANKTVVQLRAEIERKDKALKVAREQIDHRAASNYGEGRYHCNPETCPACIVDAALGQE